MTHPESTCKILLRGASRSSFKIISVFRCKGYEYHSSENGFFQPILATSTYQAEVLIKVARLAYASCSTLSIGLLITLYYSRQLRLAWQGLELNSSRILLLHHPLTFNFNLAVSPISASPAIATGSRAVRRFHCHCQILGFSVSILNFSSSILDTLATLSLTSATSKLSIIFCATLRTTCPHMKRRSNE